MYSYQAFQLITHSELELPELQPITNTKSTNIDLVIRYGAVPTDGLNNPCKKGLFFQAKPGIFWLHIPNVARFLVIAGNEIIIEPALGAAEALVRVFLLGSCFGVLLMQRGLFLLHGNAIQVDDYAISLTGQSGAGKSTLSGAFFKQGYSILADDICAINTQMEVIPSFPQIKIWADAAAQLAIDTTNLRAIRPAIEKYAFPLDSAHFCAHRLPLKVIYILTSHNKEEILIQHLSGIEKFMPLRSQRYHPLHLKALAIDKEHKKQCGQLANHVTLARIARPNTGYCIAELVEHIKHDLSLNRYHRDEI